MYTGLLFTADMHLRPDVPLCRTDDFISAQWRKLKQIQKHAIADQLIWVDAGDVFHKSNLPLPFVNRVLREMQYGQIDAGIMGNHDMPAHNKERFMESAWGSLYVTDKITRWLEGVYDDPWHVTIGSDHFPDTNVDVELYGANYGSGFPKVTNREAFKVLIMHDMVYESRNSMIPNAPGSMAKKLLRDHKEYDLIVSGHNHQSFMVELNGRHLVNVGSMTRQRADQVDHKPRVMQWTPKEGLQWVDLDYEEGVVSREHVAKQEQKEEELSAFVEAIQDINEVSLSFEDNVEAVIQETKPDNNVERKVREAME